ncbi:MAG: hypothetical protein HYV60_18650, partial [Planctomycetia bacterium]|nr:hypothetical protein [Planctomycetia bacterium]
FVVTVIDVNEAPAQLTIDSRVVSENLAGVVVGTITIIDEDVSDTHRLSIDDARFEIVGTALKLKDGIFLTRESEASVTIEVTVVDSGNPERSLVAPILLSIIENESPWQNLALPVDTNRDGVVSPLDVLVGINLLNEITTPLLTSGRLPKSRPATTTLPFYDVNGDGAMSPLDVLIVINYLNSQFSFEGESATSLDLAASDPLEATIETRVDRQVAETSLDESFASATNDDFFRIVGEREQTIRARIRGSSAEEVDLSDILDTLASDLAPRWWSKSYAKSYE